MATTDMLPEMVGLVVNLMANPMSVLSGLVSYAMGAVFDFVENVHGI
jgi:hypothetical protein